MGIVALMTRKSWPQDHNVQIILKEKMHRNTWGLHEVVHRLTEMDAADQTVVVRNEQGEEDNSISL